jgi:hypothetical protein
MSGRGQTFNYAPHNVCGGETRRVVHSVPRRTASPSLLPRQKFAEGHYVTRESGEMSVMAFLRNRAWAARLKATGQWPKE